MAAGGRGPFVRLFSSALASQVVLSAVSFGVALLLIRHVSDVQYGYYILVSGAVMLAVSLQNSFIAPAMIGRMTRLSPEQCGDLTGGLYREQRGVVLALGATAIIAVLAMRETLDPGTLPVALGAVVAIVAALWRDYFRMVLLAYRRAWEVLRCDAVYGALLVVGVLVAIRMPDTAAATAVAMALAALAGGLWLSHVLRRREAWNAAGAPGILREIAPLGTWSTAGAAIHWSFSQGYTWLVAATLDVGAVAAIAATRLLAMPVNLLTNGIGSVMLPLVAGWLQVRGPALVLRRLCLVALVIATLAAAYFGLLWLLRDWIFGSLLKKDFAQRDLLLLLWSGAFVLMAVNQQLLWLLVARARFRRLTALGLVSAVVGLSCSAWGIRHFGGAGAPFGILVGETLNLAGLSLLCLREIAPPRIPSHTAAALP